MNISDYKGVPLPEIKGYCWTDWDERDGSQARIFANPPIFSGNTKIKHRGWIEFDGRRFPGRYRVVARCTSSNDLDIRHVEDVVDTPEEAVALLSGWILMGMPE